MSYMEIYNETVTDLLVDSWKRKPLEVRETISVSELFFNDISSKLIPLSSLFRFSCQRLQVPSARRKMKARRFGLDL